MKNALSSPHAFTSRRGHRRCDRRRVGMRQQCHARREPAARNILDWTVAARDPRTRLDRARVRQRLRVHRGHGDSRRAWRRRDARGPLPCGRHRRRDGTETAARGSRERNAAPRQRAAHADGRRSSVRRHPRRELRAHDRAGRHLDCRAERRRSLLRRPDASAAAAALGRISRRGGRQGARPRRAGGAHRGSAALRVARRDARRGAPFLRRRGRQALHRPHRALQSQQAPPPPVRRSGLADRDQVLAEAHDARWKHGRRRRHRRVTTRRTSIEISSRTRRIGSSRSFPRSTCRGTRTPRCRRIPS